jgi:hypothetical protein
LPLFLSIFSPFRYFHIPFDIAMIFSLFSLMPLIISFFHLLLLFHTASIRFSLIQNRHTFRGHSHITLIHVLLFSLFSLFRFQPLIIFSSPFHYFHFDDTDYFHFDDTPHFIDYFLRYWYFLRHCLFETCHLAFIIIILRHYFDIFTDIIDYID